MKMENLNELERRLAYAREAKAIGRGGVKQVMEKYHTSRNTVMRGMRELDSGITNGIGYSRNHGGGRKKTESTYPWVLDAIRAILERERKTCAWTHVSYSRIQLMLHDEHGLDLSVMTISRMMSTYGIENHW